MRPIDAAFTPHPLAPPTKYTLESLDQLIYDNAASDPDAICSFTKGRTYRNYYSNTREYWAFLVGVPMYNELVDAIYATAYSTPFSARSSRSPIARPFVPEPGDLEHPEHFDPDAVRLARISHACECSHALREWRYYEQLSLANRPNNYSHDDQFGYHLEAYYAIEKYTALVRSGDANAPAALESFGRDWALDI